MKTGSCLCGAVKFEVEGPYKWLSYCHCAMCRKHHGTFHSVFVAADKTKFRFLQGEEDIVHYRSSSALERPFCRHCGSKVPDLSGEHASIPAGLLDGEIDAQHRIHIFVAHKSPMESITDDFKQFNDYPPGAGSAVSAPAHQEFESGNVHGSCLCGAVAFSIDSTPSKIVQCHCSRCRRTRGTAHGVNTFVRQDQFHFTRGADRVKTFQPADAQLFSTSFCMECGGLVPAPFAPMKIYLVPVGNLDTPFEVKGAVNIYVGSKAPWFSVTNPYPQYDEMPSREWFREFLFG